MDPASLTLLLSLLLVFVGLSMGWWWLALPVGCVVLLSLLGSGSRRKSMSMAPAAGTGPIIRPIVIKKKLVADSIYPKGRWKIHLSSNWDHHSMWEKAAKGWAKAATAAERVVFGRNI